MPLAQNFVSLVYYDRREKYRAIERAIRESRPDEFVIVKVKTKGEFEDVVDSYLEAFGIDVWITTTLFERSGRKFSQDAAEIVSAGSVRAYVGDNLVPGFAPEKFAGISCYVFRGGDVSQIEEFEREYEKRYGELADPVESHVDGWVVAHREDVASGKLARSNEGYSSKSALDNARSHYDLLRARNPAESKSLYSVYDGDVDVVAYADSRDAVREASQNVVLGVKALGPKHQFFDTSLYALGSALQQMSNVFNLTWNDVVAGPAKDPRFFERLARKKFAKNDDRVIAANKIEAAMKADASVTDAVRAFWAGDMPKLVKGIGHRYVKFVVCPAGFIYSASTKL